MSESILQKSFRWKPKMEINASFSSALMWAIILRLLTSTFPYSGFQKPPMYGDFEAQRHWMEITTSLPVSEWYVNSTNNDLLYWGLDYPPLTAYHSWLCGKISAQFNPSWTALNSSRGFESREHKLFMRYSVLFSEILTFFVAVVAFSALSRTNVEKDLVTWIMLLNPAIILVDHGHFQYNTVCLGFFVLFVSWVRTGHFVPAAIAFCLALNFKQIALYFALPVFLHLLKQCLSPLNVKRFFGIASAVVLTFLILWLPFIVGGKQSVLQVLSRIFPLDRGIYEDKVANFWYVSSILVKFKQLFTVSQMTKTAMAMTLLASAPSLLMLCFQGKNVERQFMNFKLALFNTSMAFFLFSYMVHEKSILFPLTALMLVSNEYPEFVLYFTGIACFSMSPLLAKDGLLVAYGALLLQFILITHKSHLEGLAERAWNRLYLLRIVMFFSLLVAVVLNLTEQLLPTPAKYPDLFVLFNCVFSFFHFVVFFLYGHMVQWRYCGSDGKEVKSR